MGAMACCLIAGSGAYFLLRSQLTPFKYLPHAFDVLRGKYRSDKDEGDVSSFKALTASLSVP